MTVKCFLQCNNDTVQCFHLGRKIGIDNEQFGTAETYEYKYSGCEKVPGNTHVCICRLYDNGEMN